MAAYTWVFYPRNFHYFQIALSKKLSYPRCDFSHIILGSSAIFLKRSRGFPYLPYLRVMNKGSAGTTKILAFSTPAYDRFGFIEKILDSQQNDFPPGATLAHFEGFLHEATSMMILRLGAGLKAPVVQAN